MDDRIAEIREAADYMVWIADVASDWPSIEENVGILANAAVAYVDLLESDALIIRRDEFYDPHDDLIGLRGFIDKRESLEFPDIGEVSNQLAAIIAKLTVLDALASSQGVELGEADGLDPEALAERLGDTFIDFHVMSPVDQWRRIVAALASSEGVEP